MSKYNIGDKVRFRGSGIVVKVPGGIGPKYVGADLCISSSALCTITGTVNMCGSEVAYFVDVAVCDLLTINVRVREEELVRVEECEGGSACAVERDDKGSMPLSKKCVSLPKGGES